MNKYIFYKYPSEHCQKNGTMSVELCLHIKNEYSTKE